MKVRNILILLVMGMIVNTTTYSQIGGININKTKEKIKKKKGDTSSDSSNSGTSGSSISNKNSTPEYDPDSPTYQAYSKAKENIKYIKSTFESVEWRSNIEGSNIKATKYLKVLQENLAILKEKGEGKKDYYTEFEQEHKNLEEFRATEFENYTIDEAYEKKMEAFYYWAKLQRPISDSTIEGSYASYKKFRSEFESNRPEKFGSAYAKKSISAIDNYLNVEVYEEIPYFDNQTEILIKKVHKLNARGEETYLLEAKSLTKDFDELLLEINYYDKFLLEKKDQMNIVFDKLKTEKTTLDEYISSGKYDLYVAKYKQELIDAIRIRKSGMSSDKYASMIKKGVDKGTVNKIAVVSSRWMISRNDFGYPKYKYLVVDIAVSHEDKCWLAYGQIVRTYEGGGNYGSEYFSYWGLQDEMNCNNINK